MKGGVLKLIILLGSLVGHSSSLKCFICSTSPDSDGDQCHEQKCPEGDTCIKVISENPQRGCFSKSFLKELGLLKNCEELDASWIYQKLDIHFRPILEHHEAVLRNSSATQSQQIEAHGRIDTLQKELKNSVQVFGGGKNSRVCQCEKDLCNGDSFGATKLTNGQDLIVSPISSFMFIMIGAVLVL